MFQNIADAENYERLEDKSNNIKYRKFLNIKIFLYMF